MKASNTQILDLIELVYDAAIDPTQWRVFLDKLTDLTGGGSGALFFQDALSRDRAEMMHYNNFDPDMMAAYETHYAATNPWVEAVEEHQSGTLHTSAMLIENKQLGKTEFFNDWLHPQGHVSGSGCIVTRDENRLLLLSILNDGKHDVEENSLTLFRTLLPHLQQSAKLSRRFSELGTMAAVGEESLNRFRVPVFVIDDLSNVVFNNSAAEDLLETVPEFRLSNGNLEYKNTQENEQLQETIHSALRVQQGEFEHAGGTVALTRPSSKQRLVCLIVPLFRGLTYFDIRRPRVLVFVLEGSEIPTVPADLLRQCYGLTHAEAELAICLSAGFPLQKAAEMKSVTYETARSQLRSIMAKTGIHRQSELIASIHATFGAIRFFD